MWGRKKNEPDPKEGADMAKRNDGFNPVPVPDPPPDRNPPGGPQEPEFTARTTRAPSDGDRPVAAPGTPEPVPGQPGTIGVTTLGDTPKNVPAGQTDPEAAERRGTRGKSRKAQEESTTYVWNIRNSFVQVDGTVKAGSEDEVKKIVTEWVMAGFEARER